MMWGRGKEKSRKKKEVRKYERKWSKKNRKKYTKLMILKRHTQHWEENNEIEKWHEVKMLFQKG